MPFTLAHPLLPVLINKAVPRLSLTPWFRKFTGYEFFKIGIRINRSYTGRYLAF